MKVLEYAAVADKSQPVMIYFTNDVAHHYYGGTIEQLREDIKFDKSLGEFTISLITKSDSTNCPSVNLPKNVTAIYVNC